MKTTMTIAAMILSAGIVMGQDIATSNDDAYGDQYVAASVRVQGMQPSEMTAASYLDQAIQLSQEENYYASLEALDKALAMDPSMALAHDYKAIAYINLGRFVKALKAVNTAIKLDPSLAEAFNHRGIVHYYLQNEEQAMMDYSQAIELKADYGTAYYNRGLLKLTIGDDNGAREDLNKAHELKCEDAAPVINEFLAEK